MMPIVNVANYTYIYYQGRTTKIGQGGGRNILSCAREARVKISPPLGMFFAPSGHTFPPFLLN